MKGLTKNQNTDEQKKQVGIFISCEVAPKPKNVKSFPSQGNLFTRTKTYRKIQLNNNNLYEKKFYHILLRDLKIRFKPQYIISPYIVDIFIPSKALIIEIDGLTHNKKINQIRDELREEYLRSFGLFIVRYTTKTKSTIKEFINQMLNTFPDIKRTRLSTIRKRVSIINNIAKIKEFKIITTNSYLEILNLYYQWRKIKRLKKEFPNWAKKNLD